MPVFSPDILVCVCVCVKGCVRGINLKALYEVQSISLYLFTGRSARNNMAAPFTYDSALNAASMYICLSGLDSAAVSRK